MGNARDMNGFHKQRLLIEPRLIKKKKEIFMSVDFVGVPVRKRDKRERMISPSSYKKIESLRQSGLKAPFSHLSLRSFSFASLQGFHLLGLQAIKPILSSEKTWKKHGSLLSLHDFTKSWVEIAGHCVSMPRRRR